MAKRIVTVALALALFLGVGELLRYVLVDDTGSYTRVMLHEMYTSKQNIDIVFLGSSHAYRSFVPGVTDEIFGEYSFNGGSSSQCMDGSYAMLREICEYHKPKRVFLELCHAMSGDNHFKNRKSLTATYILSDYMRPSLRKAEFLLRASDSRHYANSFIPARRNWKKIIDFGYMASVVKKKRTEAYGNYRLPRKEGAKEYYVERGFAANESAVDDGKRWNKYAAKYPVRIYPNEKSDWYKTLIKIIEYCKSGGVELTFVVAPLPESTIVGIGNYQVYYDYVKNIADEHGVEFRDFNLCKPAYFNADDNTFFKDEDHLNAAGAERLSRVMAEYFTGKIQEKDLFYESLRDKLDAEAPKVFGLAGPVTDPKTKERKGYVISNRESGMEYRMEARTEGGETRLIQDYDENKYFKLPADERGVLSVSWRVAGEEGSGGTLEAKY